MVDSRAFNTEAQDLTLGQFMPDATIYGGRSPDGQELLFLPFLRASSPVSHQGSLEIANKSRLCNHEDWRLPTQAEFEHLPWDILKDKVSIQMAQPRRLRTAPPPSPPVYFDPGHFWGWFWSSTQRGGEEIFAYNIFEHHGTFVHPNDERERAQTLLIRGTPAADLG